MRGRVIVIRFNNTDDREAIMRNKNKLAGSKIFKVYYRSFDERKRQEEMFTSIEGEKENEISLKIGLGKMFYKDMWYR